jgi:hypothetical protein
VYISLSLAGSGGELGLISCAIAISMELQEKFDFDAVDRHGGGPILSADLEMEGQLAFGAGRKVRFDSKAVMFLVVGVLVVCGVLLGATCGGGGCGSGEGPPSAPAVPSSGEGPPSAPAVPSTNAAATTSAQGHPAGADHQCPPGCRHVTHTSSSMFPLGTGTPASDRCDCRSQHALSGNRPPPVRLLATLMFDLRCPH